jgi:hypothetical protein
MSNDEIFPARDMDEVTFGETGNTVTVRLGEDGDGMAPDFSCPPTIDVEIAYRAEGDYPVTFETRHLVLEDEDATKLIEVLTARQQKARKAAEDAGYYQWVADGQPEYE